MERGNEIKQKREHTVGLTRTAAFKDVGDKDRIPYKHSHNPPTHQKVKSRKKSSRYKKRRYRTFKSGLDEDLPLRMEGFCAENKISITLLSAICCTFFWWV